jgi:hypothetical protein
MVIGHVSAQKNKGQREERDTPSPPRVAKGARVLVFSATLGAGDRTVVSLGRAFHAIPTLSASASPAGPVPEYRPQENNNTDAENSASNQQQIIFDEAHQLFYSAD